MQITIPSLSTGGGSFTPKPLHFASTHVVTKALISDFDTLATSNPDIWPVLPVEAETWLRGLLPDTKQPTDTELWVPNQSPVSIERVGKNTLETRQVPADRFLRVHPLLYLLIQRLEFDESTHVNRRYPLLHVQELKRLAAQYPALFEALGQPAALAASLNTVTNNPMQRELLQALLAEP